ncbi:MAG: hypothetical protein AAF961_00850 [Planctomycetota bacterium]
MICRSSSWMLVVAAALSDSAKGQHVDVLVYDAGGSVGVGLFDFDSGASDERRVHIGRFDPIYAVNNPGFTSFAGSNALPGGVDLKWDFLPMTVDLGPHEGYESTLLHWDGQGDEPVFGPTPTDEYEFSLFGQNGPAVADGGAEIVSGDVIDRTPPNGAIHQHLYFFLDDNGDGENTTLPDQGIYLVAMRLQIDGLEPSDPFFLVWATPETAVLPAIRPAAAWVTDRVDTLFVEGLSGDFNADAVVDGTDFLTWQRGLSPAPGSPADLVDWERGFGIVAEVRASVTSVPEPTGLAVGIVATTVAMMVRRALRQRTSVGRHGLLNSCRVTGAQ